MIECCCNQVIYDDDSDDEEDDVICLVCQRNEKNVPIIGNELNLYW
jgi:hypothetical protein